MQIVSALFVDDIELRQAAGTAARIDLTGVQFSAAAPGPFPVTGHAPPGRHRAVRGRTRPGPARSRWCSVRDGEQIARNVQPLQVEPGKFTYRLVRGELEFADYGTVEAHCRIDLGDATVVPYTLLPPVD